MPYDSQSKKEVRDVAASFRHLLEDKLAYTIGQMVSEMRTCGAKREHIAEYLPSFMGDIVAGIIRRDSGKGKGQSA